MKTLLERIADMAACVEGNVEEVLLDAAKEIKRLQAKIEAVEKQEPVATVDANDEGYWAEILPDRSVRVGQNLYALPGAQPAQKEVAYLDLGTGGYMDIGTDLSDEQLASLPKGRHMLGIVGTYGVDGYVPAQPAPSVPDGWKLVPIEPTQEMINHVIDERLEALVAGKEHTFIDIYKAMLAAAPKPEVK